VANNVSGGRKALQKKPPVTSQFRHSGSMPAVIQRKIGMEFEMHIFPVDRLGADKRAIAAMDDNTISQQGQVQDKTILEENDHYKLTVDNTSGANLVAGPWNTANLIFSKAASPAILEIVMKPAETAEEMTQKVNACTTLATSLFELTGGLTRRAAYGGLHIGPINNEFEDIPAQQRRLILQANGKWDLLMHHFNNSQQAVVNSFGFNRRNAAEMGLSTNAAIQANMGVSMRHFGDFARWYGQEVVGQGQGSTHKALHQAPLAAHVVNSQLPGLIAHSPMPAVLPQKTPGIEGLLTLLAMYIMGAREEADATAGSFGTEKNFTHMLSKTALYEAYQNSLTPFEKQLWATHEAVIKNSLLVTVSMLLSEGQQQPVNVHGHHKVVNWHWTNTEKETDKANPELWDAQAQRSFVNITINQLFEDIRGQKDRLLMRLYHQPTAGDNTYANEGPIAQDRDRGTGLPLNVVEFRTIPGFHAIGTWMDITRLFFEKGQQIHNIKK
jgi:hypothetical protein